MNYKKILEHLCEIEGELDDAYYSLPDYNANSDSQSYIDGARGTLYHLKDEIEKDPNFLSYPLLKSGEATILNYIEN